MKEIKGLVDLRARAREGDLKAQHLCIVALSNIGAEHLAFGKGTDWENAYEGLKRYWESLVGEYGMGEEAAEEQLVDEINFVRDLVDPKPLITALKVRQETKELFKV